MIEEHSYINADTSWVDLGGGVRAFLANPRRFKAPYPGVVIGDQQAGLTQHTQDLAAKFASFGYVAIAPDIGSSRDDKVKGDLARAMDYLKGLSQVEAKCIAAVGEGPNGEYPHLLNSVRPDLAANIVIYGGTEPSDEVIRSVTAPTLGVFGELDQQISIQDVRDLRSKLEEHKKNYEFKVFPGVPHDWMNDTLSSQYRQPDSEAAWDYIMNFLDSVYKGEAYPSDRVRWRMSTEYARA